MNSLIRLKSSNRCCSVKEDGRGHSVGSFFEFGVGKWMVPRLDGDLVGVRAHDLLESIRDRLLDLFLLELDKRPGWVEALSPYGFLLPWKLDNPF